MVFSSLLFIFFFMPVFFGFYYFLPRRAGNTVILIGSLLFYAWGAPTFIYWLCLSIAFDYFLSRLMVNAPAAERRLCLLISVGLNIVLLGYMKYANFFVHEINGLLTFFKLETIEWVTVVLPIGISFVTFQKISYVVDVYQETVEPANSLRDFMLYILLFPQLIAGPIVRYHDINEQIIKRTLNLTKVLEGFCRFCLGLAKKILLADCLGTVADKIFALDGGSLTTPYAWLGIVAYTLQIYYDFSGYSDMAIGLGRMMGFTLMENFNCPYIALNITDFWRRWHISLSRWMKEYLYIPLGGNRCGFGRGLFNLWLVFVLSGFWHGADWTFIVWGIYHGFFLTLDKLGFSRLSRKLPGAIQVLLTFFLVMMGWVVFRSVNLAQAGHFYMVLFGFNGAETSSTLLIDIISHRGRFVISAALFFAFIPFFIQSFKWCLRPQFGKKLTLSISLAGSFALFMLSVSALVNSTFHPFLYFKF